MKRILCFLLAVFMILPSLWGSVSAESSEVEVIAFVDVPHLTDRETEDLLRRGDYDQVKAIHAVALEKARTLLAAEFGSVEEIGSDDFLMPFLVLRVSESDVEELKRLPFLEDVIHNVEFEAEEEVRSRELPRLDAGKIIGIDPEFQAKYDGNGQAVAVIDANFTVDHEVFRLDDGAKEVITQQDVEKFLETNSKGSLKASQLYRNRKIPFAFHYINQSTDLNPEKMEEGHGQHVAAIAAGNTAEPFGRYSWRGVAPNAQILMMNAFSNNRTSAIYYLGALSDAVYFRTAAVNMSFGGTKGTIKKSLKDESEKKVLEMMNKARSLGTNVVIAAGNEGAYEGEISIDHPDYGTIGAPGITESAITVASMQNETYLANYFTVSGREIVYTTPERPFGEGELLFQDCGEGLTVEDCEKARDKVALIRRGNVTFSTKVANAEKAGAKGVLIYNHVDGPLSMSLTEAISIPVGGITLSDGEFLKAHANEKLKFVEKSELVKNPLYGKMSAFSNWGVTADGILKPDLTAPGQNIYSANNKNSFVEMSGTSMAAPHVSGTVALLMQGLTMREDTKGMTLGERSELVKPLLMNSAIPLTDLETGATLSPRQQGAGVVNIAKAMELSMTAVDRTTENPSVFLRQVDNEIPLELKLRNLSNKSRILIPSVVATIADRDGKRDLLRPKALFEKTFDAQKISLAARETKDASITVPLELGTELQAYENGAFVEGYLTLSSDDGQQVNFPFVAFKGDFDNLPVFEKPVNRFDFTKEHPIYWNLKPTENPWHRFMTHLESKVGDEVVVAGMKNFKEVDAAKKEGKEAPIPDFYEKTAFSPNGDGKLDTFDLYAVLTRTAEVEYEVLDAQGRAVLPRRGKKLFFKNISDWPDRLDRDPYSLGYTEIGQVFMDGLADGEYALNLIAQPVVKGATEQSMKIPFVVDREVPTLEKVDFDQRVLSFRVFDNVDIREVKIPILERRWDFEKNQYLIIDKSIFLTPDADGIYRAEIEKLGLDTTASIQVTDSAYNSYSETVDQMTGADYIGALEVVGETANGERISIDYQVYDEDRRPLVNGNKLKKGNYSIVFRDPNLEYKVDAAALQARYGDRYEEDYGSHILSFEVTEAAPKVRLTVDLVRQKLGKLLVLTSGTGALITYEDFDLYAVKDTEPDSGTLTDDGEIKRRGILLTQEVPGYPQHYLVAPYGKYYLYVVFSNKTTESKYNYSFDKRYVEIGDASFEDRVDVIFSENQYKILPINEGYDGEIQYVGFNKSVGLVTDARNLGRGTSQIAPINLPEGYFVEPGMAEVSLTESSPVARPVFRYRTMTEADHFILNITDDAKEHGIEAKYKIYDFSAYYSVDKRFSLVKPAFVADYTPGMKLAPGWYVAVAQYDKHNPNNLIKPIAERPFSDDDNTLVERYDGGTVEVNFSWSKEAPKRYGRKITIEASDEVKAELKDGIDIECVIKNGEDPQKEKYVLHRFLFDDEETHTVLLQEGAYDLHIVGLNDRYKTTSGEVWVFGPDGWGATLSIEKRTPREVLEALVASTEEFKKSERYRNLKEEQKAELEEKLSAAVELLKNDQATEEALNNALDELQALVEKLTKKPDEKLVEELKGLIAESVGFKNSPRYRGASFRLKKDYDEAIAAAEELLAGSFDDEELTRAILKIRSVIQEIEAYRPPREDEETRPYRPEAPKKPKNDVKKSESEKKPETPAPIKHFSYVGGTPEGKFLPSRELRRSEASVMIAKLMGWKPNGSNETPFADASGTWFSGAVNELTQKGYLSGYSDGKFQPERSITRAEFVTVLVRMLGGSAGNASFSDTEGHWAKEAVQIAVNNGWVSGYPNGTFRPDSPITRAEAVVLLNRAFRRPVARAMSVQVKSFADVPAGHWAYWDILAATMDLAE